MSEFAWPVLLFLGFIGCFAGFMAGLLGMGGGVIYNPLFLWAFALFGVSPEIGVHLAFGTSLAIILPTALSGLRVHYAAGSIHWDQVWRLALGSSLGALVGGRFAALTPGLWLRALFGLMLLGVAARVSWAHPVPCDDSEVGKAQLTRLFPVGFAGGSFAAFFGVSGAIVVLPLLLLVMKQPMQTAVASSSALMVVSCTVGVFSYVFHGWNHPLLPPFSYGFVNLLIVGVCLPTTTIFAHLGAKMTHRFSHERLIRIYAGVLTVVGLWMVGNTLVRLIR
ncbi:MAG: sulfite exporter TauE/SafE family protein [Deltaproteobacteria bacterium]|nr:sulfite exporter TauE/SafE family protein [Deltaproteobacteria bacterium]